MKLASILPVAAALLALAAPARVTAADRPLQHHVRGTVSAVAGDKVTIATADGPVVVTVGPQTRFAGMAPASAADIVTGTFIGTANVPGPGVARALEVVVFPKSLAGTGEGDYPWDLPAAGQHSSMTNGTVVAPKLSSMTNATVSRVHDGATKTVTLTYSGGTKVVEIPPNTPIVHVVAASRALVVPGAHVVATQGDPYARNIIVGVDGAVPPM